MKLSLVLVVLLPALASAATAKRIVGTWRSSADRVSSGSFVITRDGETYEIVREGDSSTDGRSRVSAEIVQRLVDAVTAPVIPELEPQLVITSAEVNAVLEPYLRGVSAADAGWLDRARDPRNLASFVRQYFATGIWNSEGRSFVSFDIVLDDGRTLHLVSWSEHAFMLPWTSIEGARRSVTWNPEISRALAAAWPGHADRLSGRRVAEDIFQQPGSDQNVADPLRGSGVTRYDVAYTGPVHSLNTRREVGWTSFVTLPAWKGGGFDVFLTKTKHGFASIEPFLRDASVLASRVRALRWLTPNAFVIVAYHDDRSITATGRETIAEDLRLAGVPPLSPPALDGALAFVTESERTSSLWVLFENGTSMRIYGPCVAGPLCPPIGQIVTP